MENEMRKQIDKVKSLGKFLNENTENRNNFNVDDIVLYNDEYVAKVIKLHDGYELLRIKIYHPNSLLNTTTSDVSSTLCEKYED